MSCIVSCFLGGMQNAWASFLVVNLSCFALVDLIFWRVCCCSSCCRDLSHCRSFCCSRCGDMSNCYIIQTGESSSGVLVAFVRTWKCKELEVGTTFNVGTWKCEKLEVGTTINWDIILLIVEAETSFGVGTDNRSKVELSFDSDFWGFVLKFAWSIHSISFARCIPLELFQKLSSLLRCESNAFAIVWSMRKIAINVSSVRSMFMKKNSKEVLCFVVTRWCL